MRSPKRNEYLYCTQLLQSTENACTCNFVTFVLFWGRFGIKLDRKDCLPQNVTYTEELLNNYPPLGKISFWGKGSFIMKTEKLSFIFENTSIAGVCTKLSLLTTGGPVV